jgi:hypothetical protein
LQNIDRELDERSSSSEEGLFAKEVRLAQSQSLMTIVLT